MIILFDSSIMLRFSESKVAKEKLYGAKKTVNIWDVNVDNVVVSKLIKTKTNPYVFDWILKMMLLLLKPVALMLLKLSGYVKTFKK